MNQLSFPIVPSWDVVHSLTRARQERDKGIKRVAGNNAIWLDRMRNVATMFCHQKGWVCADDLRAWCDQYSFYPTHPNAFGAIFTKKEFVPGEYIVSKQPLGHCNRVRKWRLK